MASPTWILLFCMLLSAVPDSQGLEFYKTTTPGSYFCANVQCSHDANEQEGEQFTIRRISLFDVTHAGSKVQLSYRKFSETELYVNPIKVHDINGTSKISKFHADFCLDFHNETDCRDEILQCEVEFLDATGKKQVISKTLTPDAPNVDGDCSCSSITYSLDRLTNRANEASRQVYGLTLNLDNLENDLDDVKNDSTELSKDIARLQESHQSLQVSVNELRETDREIDINMNELRHNDSVLNSDIDSLRRADQDMQDTTNVLKENDKNIDKQLNVLTRNDNVQLNAIMSLQQTDAVIEGEFNNLDDNDNDLENKVNDLRNESSSLRSQIVVLKENDNSLRVDIAELNARDAEIQGAITELEHTDNVIDRGIVELTRNNVDIQEGVAQMQYATAAKTTEMNELSQTYCNLEAEIARQKQKDLLIDDSISGLKRKDKETEDELNGLLRADVVLQQAIDALKITSAVHQESTDNLRRNDTAKGLEITDLRVQDRVIDDRINDLSRNNSDLRGGLNVVRAQHSDIRDELDSITNQLLVIESQVNTTKITTVSETTSSLILTSCTRGMPHDNPRASIMLDGNVPTVCDTQTDGGGWVLIQKRKSDAVSFYRSWSDYELGFGNPATNFYIGNIIISNLTARGFTELRIDLAIDDDDEDQKYAHYAEFRVGDKASKYRLHVADYQGTAGDSFSYHDGMKFSTYDEDNDASVDNCAKSKVGGWWYKDCYESNLNGVYGADDDTGIIWKRLSKSKSAFFVEMKLRFVG